MQETAQQRAERIVERARNLKAERVAKTREAAQAAYHRQWRDGCDDLRALESEKFRLHCLEEVAQQRQDNILEVERQRQVEAEWAAVGESGRQELLRKEKREEDERKAALYDNRNALLAQMADSRQQRAEQAAGLARERQQFADQMQKDAEDAHQELIRKHQAKRELHARTLDFNAQEFQRKRELEQRNLMEEKMLLDRNIAHIAAEKEAKAIDKRAKAREISVFRTFLEDQRAIDRKRDADFEKRIQQDLELNNAKQDKLIKRQENARKQLLRNVYDVRKQQVEENGKLVIHAST
jgi:hypothetical protein